jgi:hypothetical protein
MPLCFAQSEKEFVGRAAKEAGKEASFCGRVGTERDACKTASIKPTLENRRMIHAFSRQSS